MNQNLKHNKRSDIVLPEYGRNIQRMVEIAVEIEDRNERNRCARTIIDSMGNLFPYLRDVEGYKHKLWDHLAVMSKFKLDIDYPHDVHKAENLNKVPEKIELKKSRIYQLHYGRIVQEYINFVAENPNIANKEEMIMNLANQMKKSYTAWNKDNVEDVQIFNDIKEISNGEFNLSSEDKKLNYRRYNNNNNNNNRGRQQQRQRNFKG